MGKYRIPSARHPTWDYASNGRYFITICTHKRHHHFGKIINQKMELSEIGKWAEDCWHEIPSHFPFVILHNHIIMPDHMHGIIEIAKKEGDGMPSAPGQNTGYVQTQNFAPLAAQNTGHGQTQNIASLPSSPYPPNPPRPIRPHFQKTNSDPNLKTLHPSSVDTKSA